MPCDTVSMAACVEDIIDPCDFIFANYTKLHLRRLQSSLNFFELCGLSSTDATDGLFDLHKLGQARSFVLSQA